MHAELKYKNIWLIIGYGLISLLIYQTLVSDPIGIDSRVSDKTLHVTGYFILMGWFVQIYHDKKQKFLCAVFFLAMGIGLEFLQDFGGVRYFEVNDMLANGLGVLLAWALSVTGFSNSIFLFEKYILKVTA